MSSSSIPIITQSLSSSAAPTSLVFNITIVYQNFQHPEENSFSLKDSENGQVHSQISTGELTGPGIFSVELGSGGYVLELVDSYGDGFRDDDASYTGGYMDLLVDGERIFHVADEFLDSGTFSFQVPLATVNPTFFRL